eukprot:TRINITY_DN22934_c0_g1_i1.p1 TRINITY_DN22934_c0_g1~~TRINITY_DN22934_c0_g1_i1.p1  ORF type:complete len:110 (-),score=21.39 TRINITY_DN22934_c0_g1_i1:364-693(-)
MIRRPPRSTQSRSSAASDVYKRQEYGQLENVTDPLARATTLLFLIASTLLVSNLSKIVWTQATTTQIPSTRTLKTFSVGPYLIARGLKLTSSCFHEHHPPIRYKPAPAA